MNSPSWFSPYIVFGGCKCPHFPGPRRYTEVAPNAEVPRVRTCGGEGNWMLFRSRWPCTWERCRLTGTTGGFSSDDPQFFLLDRTKSCHRQDTWAWSEQISQKELFFFLSLLPSLPPFFPLPPFLFLSLFLVLDEFVLIKINCTHWWDWLPFLYMFTLYINHVVTLLSFPTVSSLTFLLILFLCLFPLSLPPPFFFPLSLFVTLSFKSKAKQNNKRIAASVQRHLSWFHASLNGKTSHVHGLKDLLLLKSPHCSSLPPHCCPCAFTPYFLVCPHGPLEHCFCPRYVQDLIKPSSANAGIVLLLQDRYCDVNTLNRMYSGCRTSPQKD